MTRDVDNIVHPTSDPEIPIFVSTSTVTCELHKTLEAGQKVFGLEAYIETLVDIEIRLLEPRMSVPNSPRHTWPRLADGEYTFFPGIRDFVAGYRIHYNSIDTKAGSTGTTWLHRSYPGKRSNQMRASLRLPIRLRLWLV